MSSLVFLNLGIRTNFIQHIGRDTLVDTHIITNNNSIPNSTNSIRFENLRIGIRTLRAGVYGSGVLNQNITSRVGIEIGETTIGS
ncbi:2384_t:CDS:2, partial [Racocetra persica]